MIDSQGSCAKRNYEVCHRHNSIEVIAMTTEKYRLGSAGNLFALANICYDSVALNGTGCLYPIQVIYVCFGAPINGAPRFL